MMACSSLDEVWVHGIIALHNLIDLPRSLLQLSAEDHYFLPFTTMT